MRVRGVSWRWGTRLCLRDLQVRVPKVCRLAFKVVVFVLDYIFYILLLDSVLQVDPVRSDLKRRAPKDSLPFQLNRFWSPGTLLELKDVTISC